MVGYQIPIIKRIKAGSINSPGACIFNLTGYVISPIITT